WVLYREPRRAVLVAAAAVLFYAPWAWFYASTYGNPFGPSTQQLAGGNWSWKLDSLWGVLASPSRGVLVYQPWLLLALAAPLARPWRVAGRAGLAALGWFCVAVIGLQVALVSGWRCWWGGDCWGSRLVAEAVPVAALLCVGPVAVLWTKAGG